MTLSMDFLDHFVAEAAGPNSKKRKAEESLDEALPGFSSPSKLAKTVSNTSMLLAQQQLTAR